MKRYLGTTIVAIVFFAFGAAFQRYYDAHPASTSRPGTPPLTDSAATDGKAAAKVPSIAFDREPLWAYGFETPAKAGDTAVPQNPPSRNLRPNEDPLEQTKPRGAPTAAARPIRSWTSATGTTSSTGFPATIRRRCRM